MICLVVGIAGCVGAFFLFHSKDQSEDANKAANDSESSIATDAEETAGTSEQDSEKPAKTTSAAKHTDSSEDEEFEKKQPARTMQRQCWMQPIRCLNHKALPAPEIIDMEMMQKSMNS